MSVYVDHMKANKYHELKAAKWNGAKVQAILNEIADYHKTVK